MDDYIEIDLTVVVQVRLIEGSEPQPGLLQRAEQAARIGVANAVRQAADNGFDQPHPEFAIEHAATYVTSSFAREGDA